MQSKNSLNKQQNNSVIFFLCHVILPVFSIILIFFARYYHNTSWARTAAVVGFSGVALWFFFDFIKSKKEGNLDGAIVSLVKAITVLSSIFLFMYRQMLKR